MNAEFFINILSVIAGIWITAAGAVVTLLLYQALRYRK